MEPEEKSHELKSTDFEEHSISVRDKVAEVKNLILLLECLSKNSKVGRLYQIWNEIADFQAYLTCTKEKVKVYFLNSTCFDSLKKE